DAYPSRDGSKQLFVSVEKADFSRHPSTTKEGDRIYAGKQSTFDNGVGYCTGSRHKRSCTANFLSAL
ncbi:hypothetical protein AB9E06_37870, partial [Rhizobium leguminosarum]|uniref:hypothetical protein n=1 Tax=Rhizobium leguminosarum TaxID=384 RepID=UPI003F9C8D2D